MWIGQHHVFVFGEHVLVGPYMLYKTNGETIILTTPPGWSPPDGASPIRITSKVDRIGVSGNLIYGHVVRSPLSEVSRQTPGYFIVDAATNQLVMVGGTDQKVWEQRCRSLARMRDVQTRVVH
jgi:hypothetical protein